MGCSYSYVGAVVGATYPEMGKVLRKIMPKATFLFRDMCSGRPGERSCTFLQRGWTWRNRQFLQRIIAAYKQEKYASFGPEAFGDASRAAVEDMIADIRGALENR